MVGLPSVSLPELVRVLPLCLLSTHSNGTSRACHASPCLGVRPEPLALVSRARLPPIVERLCGLGPFGLACSLVTMLRNSAPHVCTAYATPHFQCSACTGSPLGTHPRPAPRGSAAWQQRWWRWHRGRRLHESPAAAAPAPGPCWEGAHAKELGTYRSNLGSRKHTGKMCPAAHGLTIQQRQLPVHSPALLALAVERRQQLVLQESGASRIQLRAQPAAQLGAAAQRLPQAPGNGTVERSTGLGRPVSIALNGGPHATGTLVSACKHSLLPLPSAFHCKLCRRNLQPSLPAILPAILPGPHSLAREAVDAPHAAHIHLACRQALRWGEIDRACEPGMVYERSRLRARARGQGAPAKHTTTHGAQARLQAPFPVKRAHTACAPHPPVAAQPAP